MPGAPISSPLLRFWPRWSARPTALAAALLLSGAGASAQEQNADCQGLLKRFDQLITRYHAAGEKAIEKLDPPAALEKAHQEALKGSAEATVAMVGVGVVLRGKRDQFPVSMIRQVCTFSARNGHLLHVTTCAYFNALNPLGNREDKRRAVEVELERFDKTRKAPASGSFSPPDEFSGHIDALKACLPKV